MSHPLNHFFGPVGRVVVLFNQIDITLTLLAGGMCISEFGAVSALMAEASFSRKLDALRCIGDTKITDASLVKRLQEVLKKLQAAEDTRNRIVHTSWSGSPSGQLMKLKWSAKRKTGNLPGLRNATLKEIEEAGDEIRSAFADLVAFVRILQRSGIVKIKFVEDA